MNFQVSINVIKIKHMKMVWFYDVKENRILMPIVYWNLYILPGTGAGKEGYRSTALAQTADRLYDREI